MTTKKDVDELKDKIDVISNENKDLEEEISMCKSRLARLDREVRRKQPQIKEWEAVAKEETQLQSVLAGLEKRVHVHLEILESLEEKGLFDQDQADAILKEQGDLIKALREDIRKVEEQL